MGKRLAMYIGGLAVTAFGIALIILSLLGAGPWDAVAVGLTRHLGLTIGMWSIISQLFFTWLTWILEKTRFKIESLIPIMIRSCFLDFWFYFVLKDADSSYSWESQLLCFCAGLLLGGIGIGIYMEAQLPKTPIDGLMVAISNRFGWTYSRSRMSIEGTGAMLGYLLGGPVGLGTLLTALCLGRIIYIVNRLVKKVFYGQTDSLEI
ncbi:YitT family protein [Siminovitchia sediminis]|uniref:YitT family protein n=1 Tax=Siminovitchia sediminis TaxID=1274353 RepID=A0ABW4KMT5_9BACI